MLKKYFFLLLMSFSINQLFSQSIKETLLYHQNSDNSYQLVFIDAPHSSYHQKVFESLMSDNFTINEKSVFNSDSKFSIDKKIITKFLGDWISTCTYKDKVYAYYPSEPYYNVYIKITDSTIVLNDFNEGLVPYAIKEITKQNNIYVFNVISPSSEVHTIYLFMMKNNLIAVKSSIFNRPNVWLTKKKNFLKLPIIVNLCPGNKCEEFHFN